MGVYNSRRIFPARAVRPMSDTGVCVVAVAVICVLVLHWLRPGFLIGSVDFFPDFSPGTLLLKSFDAWGHVKGPFGRFKLSDVRSTLRIFGSR